MISMTGYASAEEHNANRQLSIEIKAYNNRYLDIYLNMPGYLAALEGDIRAAIAQVVRRGKVEVVVRLREYAAAVSYHLDRNAARAALAVLQELSALTAETDRLLVSREISITAVAAFEGVMQIERSTDADAYRAPILSLLGQALNSFQESRRREGEITARDIEANLKRIAHAAAVFEANAARMEQLVFETVRAKFSQALGSQVDEARVLTEAAALLLRHATNEESVRLTAHIAAFRSTVAAAGHTGDGIGKKLDFICQEMNREINTMTNKSTLIEVHGAAIDAKDALEMIREQVRNIE